MPNMLNRSFKWSQLNLESVHVGPVRYDFGKPRGDCGKNLTTADRFFDFSEAIFVSFMKNKIGNITVS